MRESRLFKIIYHLLDKGCATAPELAKKLEVSVRTIYRDIDALSGAGIPVYAEAGRNGGIYLLDDFVLNRVVLSEQEKQQILTALQSLAAVGNVYEENILEKLSALFRVHSDNWFEVDFSRWGDTERDNEKFELLKSAVVHCKCARITYANSYEEIGERTIQPLKLSYKGQAWYLKAYCMEKQDYRIFKLTRILDLEILDETFLPRSFPEKEILPSQYNQITLQFSKEVAYRVYDEFNIEQIKQQENGDLLVSARLPEDNWFVGFLLSFGTRVEVIEPAYLREVLAEQALMIYEKNKT
ncbi:MAG: YafY family transcriptional regulator [Lachnospiraceae bacterium]|nr:YafY family transcriptional regulator [Lachnospiraceae bacterium]MDE6625253.1 YafY family transcriptional regulator [Lachnospiraceae bacterium]